MGADNQLKDYRVGEVSYTKHGTKATIVEYLNRHKVLVEFGDKFRYRYYTSYANFKHGNLTNPYEVRTKDGRNIGYIGVGKYNSKNAKEAYQKWRAIIQRCFCSDYKDKANLSIASYEPCNICEEWLNFQNFAEWYYSNLYKCDEQLCVDKDILFHNNKEYSPDKCVIVPRRINLLFIKELGRRGNLPIGVSIDKRNNQYVSQISKIINGKHKGIRIGQFRTIPEAYEAYKREKEKYIKEIADEYKDVIPSFIYEALYKYEIYITD